MKVKITTIDDDQGWLDSAGIDYKVNDVVEMDRTEFDRLNRYAESINREVWGPAISIEDVDATKRNAVEAMELLTRSEEQSHLKRGI